METKKHLWCSSKCTDSGKSSLQAEQLQIAAAAAKSDRSQLKAARQFVLIADFVHSETCDNSSTDLAAQT